MTRIIEKICKLNPSIVFVEKNISSIAKDLLLRRNITVATQFKQHILRKIAKSTKARYIQKLDRIDKYDPHKVLGHCQHISFRR